MVRTVRALAAIAAFAVFAAPVSAQLAARGVEPVILTGADVPAWSGPASTIVCQPYPSGALTGERDAHNGIPAAPPAIGVPIDEIAAYRWDDVGLAFVEIPVQVDEMYFYCLSNPPSDFAIYSGTDKELTYKWDNETWRKIDGQCTATYPVGFADPNPDPVPGLDNDDEIVFMASDAGTVAPPGAPWPAGATDSQAVVLTDPLDAATLRYVYLFRKPGGSSFDASNGYVSYVRDADADEWIDRHSFADDDPEKLGSSNTGYGPNLAGTVCRTSQAPGKPGCAAGTPCPDGQPRNSTDRFPRDGITVSTDTYEARATGRWMFRGVRIAKPGQPGVYGPDLVDRWKGRAFQQSPDSSISLVGFEDEQVNWEANAALLGERMGSVRAIREIWGADSGTNVTKTEAFYRDVITHRYHVRVHPIPPDGLYTSWDYNAGVATKYYNVIKPDGVDINGVNDDVGNVDSAPFVGPAFFDAPDPTFNAPSAILNWEQVSGVGDAGSLVYIIEMKGATTLASPAVVPYYRDDSCLDDGTGDDPVARPWPGESTTDSRVRNGYCAANGEPNGCIVCQGAEGGGPTCDVDCLDQTTQGIYGGHGVHYFVTGDTDNAASPEVLTEIDAQQWQFAVSTSTPTNVGQQYGNVVIAPLQLATLNDPGILGLAPPSAGNVDSSTAAGASVEITLTGLDLDTCELTFVVVTPPSNGSLGTVGNLGCTPGVPNTDRATITYTPGTTFVGTDSFTYTVSDGTLTSLPATVTIEVVNERPVASHVSATTDADLAVEVELAASDEEECELAFSIVDPPANGSLGTISDDACQAGSPLNFDTARIVYTPDPGFAGQDVFTYKVNDGFRDSTPPARATITVIAAATAPTAAAVATSTDAETPVAIELSATDEQQCELSFAIVSGPSNGAVSPVSNQPCVPGSPNADSAFVTYTPDAGFAGIDSFAYKANDGQSDSNPASVTIEVAAPIGCASGPIADCRVLQQGGVSILIIKDGLPDSKDKLRWKWTDTTQVPKTEYADPLAATHYDFCVYDGDGAPLAGFSMEAGAQCGGRPCWRELARGYRYKSREDTAEGRSSVLAFLREGLENRRAKIIVRGSGPGLNLGSLGSLAQPLRAQISNSDGDCWGAVFSAPAQKDTGNAYKDKAD